MASKEKLEAYLAEPRNIIVAGVRKDGRPHVTPNWFYWDGERFNISTTRPRAKYHIFKRDPRAELVVDDSTHFRCVMVSGGAEIREDIEAVRPQFRAIREKHAIKVPSDEEHFASLRADERVLLVITPDKPVDEWIAWGFD